MGAQDLAVVLTEMARKQARFLALPIEYGTVTQAPGGGSDLQVKPDSMSLSLSWSAGELAVADGLRLVQGDRVVIVGVQGGQDYCVLAKLARTPAV